MKYFLDTEFIEQPNTIELISIGIVAEDGREYYGVNTECDCSNASDWVKENVLKNMPEYTGASYNDLRSYKYHGSLATKKTVADIKNDLLFFLGTKNNVPEQCAFYSYFGAYDWVIFCWIFGRMIDLPESFPKYQIDLKQMMKERGLTTEWKRQTLPDPPGEHNALIDAKWNKMLYGKIIQAVPTYEKWLADHQAPNEQ